MRLFITISALIIASSSGGFATDTRGLVQEFAACAGRHAAQMEWTWLTQEGNADLNHNRRAAFVDLIEALLPEAEAAGVSSRTILSWRIAAKSAQAQLLRRTLADRNAAHRVGASALARQHLAQCDDYLPARLEY